MLFIVRHVFFSIYSWARKVKTNPAPEASTLVGLSVLMGTNVFTLFAAYSLVTRTKVDIEGPSQRGILAILLFCFFFVYLYSANIRGGKLAQIEAELSQEPKRERRAWAIFTAIYIVATMLLFFLSMFVAMMRNRGAW